MEAGFRCLKHVPDEGFLRALEEYCVSVSFSGFSGKDLAAVHTVSSWLLYTYRADKHNRWLTLSYQFKHLFAGCVPIKLPPWVRFRQGFRGGM